MRAVPPELRHYLLVEHVAGSAVFNFLINALIAWLSFRQEPAVPLWGQQSIVGDLLGTTIILPTLTCLIVTRIVRLHLRRGRIQSTGFTGAAGSLLIRLPEGAFLRGLTVGAATMAVFAPPMILALLAAGIGGLEVGTFVWFKASYAGLMGAMVQPVIALWAIMYGAGPEPVLEVSRDGVAG